MIYLIKGFIAFSVIIFRKPDKRIACLKTYFCDNKTFTIPPLTLNQIQMQRNFESATCSQCLSYIVIVATS